MGMFEKDKEIGLILQKYLPQDEEFILWGVSIIREDFPTDLGPTPQASLTVSRLADRRGVERVDTTTLASSIVAKVREADPTDFPCVVYWTTVPSKFGQPATVLQFVKMLSPPRNAGQDTAPAATDEEIPF